MPSADEAYTQLKKEPEFRRLMSIARSDNPLIALGVTKREVSWTQFQAWLLDPVRHPERLGICFVEALLATATTGIDKVIQKSEPQFKPTPSNCLTGQIGLYFYF